MRPVTTVHVAGHLILIVQAHVTEKKNNKTKPEQKGGCAHISYNYLIALITQTVLRSLKPYHNLIEIR